MKANITSKVEGRYFKAYLMYLAGERTWPPAPSFYGVDRNRAFLLRSQAVDVADALIARGRPRRRR